MRFQASRGTEDVLPSEVHRWLRLESIFRKTCALYGYEEIRTPTFEDTNLFIRTAGESSDVVSKEMYSFLDKGDRPITLKPEGTAPAIRAGVEHSLFAQGTVNRLCLITPIFRYGRPQKGRLREGHQFGIELIGSLSPHADAEIIELTIQLFKEFGLGDLTVLLNSLGKESCRTKYRSALLEFARPFLEEYPLEMREKAEKNPLRLLDSKDQKLKAALQEAPSILGFLEDDSRARFEYLQQLLTDAEVKFHISPETVRGLDYYSETVFEVESPLLGAQGSLCGGGRYDGLVKELGGPPVPSVGVGIGIERVLIVEEALGISLPSTGIDGFVVTATPDAEGDAMKLVRTLRSGGLSVLRDFEGKGMSQQLKAADRAKSKLTFIIGEDELVEGVVLVRNMRTSTQEKVEASKVLSYSKAVLGT